jgi:hypothetical protein
MIEPAQGAPRAIREQPAAKLAGLTNLVANYIGHSRRQRSYKIDF